MHVIEFILILLLHPRETDLIITVAQQRNNGEKESGGKSRQEAMCSVSDWFVNSDWFVHNKGWGLWSDHRTG